MINLFCLIISAASPLGGYHGYPPAPGGSTAVPFGGLGSPALLTPPLTHLSNSSRTAVGLPQDRKKREREERERREREERERREEQERREREERERREREERDRREREQQRSRDLELRLSRDSSSSQFKVKIKCLIY